MGHVRRTGVERNFCLGSLQGGMWCQGGGRPQRPGSEGLGGPTLWSGCLTLEAGTGHCTGAGIWERRRGQADGGLDICVDKGLGLKPGPPMWRGRE